jgi:hypothetical protein
MAAVVWEGSRRQHASAAVLLYVNPPAHSNVSPHPTPHYLLPAWPIPALDDVLITGPEVCQALH